jgi:hypothetical protein
MQKALVLGVVGLLFLPVRAVAEKQMIDDLESAGRWEVKEWGDQATLSASTAHVAQGTRALAVSFGKTGRRGTDKGVIIRRPLLGRANDFKEFAVDIHNPTAKPFNVALGVEADEYYEAPAQPMQPGWNKNVRFRVDGSNLKAARSNWRHELSLDPTLNLGSLILVFHVDHVPSATIHIDNLRADGTGGARALAAATARIAPHDIEIERVRGQRAELPAYDTLELSVDLGAVYLDPYDADEIALAARVRRPDGQQQLVPGFFYSGDVTGHAPVRDGTWRIRLTPDQPGEWSYQIVARNRWSEAVAGPYQLQTTASAHPGFVRVDPAHPHYFAFDSGAFYYPIGQNFGWGSTEEYQRIVPRMAASGQNWMRVWMANWSFGLEWKPMGYYRGLGNYNLVNAQKLDELFELARKHGMFIQLVFDFHGALSSKVNPEWSNNPYNAANGGPLAHASEFFTNPRAKELYKRRVRYILARWGHHPNLLAWEFFNEINFSDGFDKQADAAWHQEMSAYVKANDPYRHLTTTSYYDFYNQDCYALPTIDYTQYHVYRRRVHNVMANVVPRFRRFAKPFFFAEFGSHSENGIDDEDRRGVFLHAGMWAQFMQNASGGAMPWWWDTHIDANDLYYHFKALTAFARGIDRRTLNPRAVRQRLKLRAAGTLYFFELQGQQDESLSFFWLADALGTHHKDRPAPITFEGLSVSLSNVSDGEYSIEHWDTYRGTVVATNKGTARGGSLVIPLPRFTNDTAFKVRKVN